MTNAIYFDLYRDDTSESTSSCDASQQLSIVLDQDRQSSSLYSVIGKAFSSLRFQRSAHPQSQTLRTHGFLSNCRSLLQCYSNAKLLIYGQRRAFSGPIVTLKVFEVNVLVWELLETKREGRVLVIDGGESMRCALVGGNLAQLAQTMEWAGIVVNGCIRDVDEINTCDVGVRALASHPLKSNKKRIGEVHANIHIGGALVRDGEWLYADSDGILVSKTELSI